jgi:hypothetical protein
MSSSIQTDLFENQERKSNWKGRKGAIMLKMAPQQGRVF